MTGDNNQKKETGNGLTDREYGSRGLLERRFLRYAEMVAAVGAIIGVCGLLFQVGKFKGEVTTEIKNLRLQLTALSDNSSKRDEKRRDLEARLSASQERLGSLRERVEGIEDGLRQVRSRPLRHQIDRVSLNVSRIEEVIRTLDVRLAGAECTASDGTFNFTDQTCTLPDGRSWRHRSIM